MTRRTLLLAQSSAAAIEEAFEADLRNRFATAYNAATQARNKGVRDLKLEARERELGRRIYCKKGAD